MEPGCLLFSFLLTFIVPRRCVCTQLDSALEEVEEAADEDAPALLVAAANALTAAEEAGADTGTAKKRFQKLWVCEPVPGRAFGLQSANMVAPYGDFFL